MKMTQHNKPYSESGSASVMWFVAVTEGPTRVRDVMEYFDMAKAHAKKVLSRLEATGLIIQEPTLVEADQGTVTAKGYRIAIPEHD